MKFIRKIYDWMETKVHSSWADAWLALLFFIEASFFIIPVDPLLILYCLAKRKKALYYAALATLASTLGGLFGYLIGAVMWHSVGMQLVHWLISETTFNQVVERYRLYEHWVVLIAGFTPVPYKAITISAGFCKLPLIPFVVFSIIGRGARFFLLAGAIRVWGDVIKAFIDRFFNYLVIAFVIILVLSCNLLKGAGMIELSIPELRKIEALAQSNEGCISFSQGALRIGGVDHDIKEYVRQILLTDKADYYQDSLGILPLRKKLAEVLSEQHHMTIGVEQVMISHGGIGALTTLCLGLLGQDDEVVLLEPTYPVYKNIITFSKAKTVIVPAFTLEQYENGFTWQFHPDKVQEALTSRTKMIIIANPSNPSGVCLSKQQLLFLKKLCQERGIYLVVDEVYDEYLFEGEFFSCTAWAAESPLVMRVGSFSKSFGMSGWRIGYLVAHPSVIKGLAPLQGSTLSCPSVIGQYAALYALEHKNEILARCVEKVKKSKELVCAFFDLLQQQGIVTYAKPAAGFYLFFKLEESDSISFVMDVLNSVKVALAPGKDFGPNMTPYVRFCFARDPEIIKEGIKRLQLYFSQRSLLQHAKTSDARFYPLH